MEQKILSDPIALFKEWIEIARQSEINDPEAMALATCNSNGQPSVRMVLLKEINDLGFKFHTNAESHKGCDLKENPKAALCFYWKSIRKQIRVEGLIEQASKEEADRYFQDRPYARQIGAWASAQSRPLESREFLEQKIEKIKQKYPEGTSVPRPDYWIGYRLKPHKIEFWWDNPDRLHDRFLYTKNDKDGWDIQRLYP